MDNQDAHDAPVINSVSVKMPPFWPDEPVLWFAQMESQFTLANITADTTKYNYVVSNLDYKYVSEIKDIIKNPPTTDKYISLKTELISRLSSSQERVRQLLTHEDIGDRKPSQFLRHLQNLAGPEIPDDFIRSIWSSRLPTNIQVIIASQPKSSLDSLASLADAVTDVMCQPQINHVASPHDEIKELRNCVAELTKQVAALSTSTSRRPRSRSGQRAYESRRRSYSHGRSRDVSTSGVCWYHRTFKENATKCRAPFDVRNHKLVDVTTTLKASAKPASATVYQIKTVSGTSRYHILLTEFPEVTKPSGEPGVREIKHKTLHYIRTTPGPPVFSRPRRLAPDRLRRAKREFEDMTDVRHISGDDNVLADALSRIEAISNIDLDQLAAAQDRDAELNDILNSNSSLNLKKIYISYSSKGYCDISSPSPRLYLTPNFRKQAFNSIHGLSHPGAKPTIRLMTESVAYGFVNEWIARFGCPLKITTDRGRQFESHLFKELARLTGSEHISTTAYHPAANGLVERFHRQLKAAIMCHDNENWHAVLPLVLLGIRSAWKEDISSSSAELLYGEGLRLPGDLFISSGTEITDHSDFLSRLRQHISQLKPTPVMRHGKAKTFVHKDLKQATSVFLRQEAVRKSLKPPYSGPYKVLDRTDKTMRIEMDGKTTTVSIDRVKPAHILTEEEPINNTIAVPSMPPAKKPDYVTRSGRRVLFPRHFCVL
ncbi:unnamed protein product [Pieris brassicae]|uniref:Integrase catalytic domain-containing protein n=1 Tax=Pieris brassicae TaxID=7116 RepID=A0A9P0TVY4_PIEBR|nr:unnamed protein product [Pieris brassicae]